MLYRVQTDQYGKTLVLLAGGGLALSITFLEKIAGPSPNHKWMLVIGWILLVLTVVGTLAALLFSSEALLDATHQYPWRDQRSELGGRSAKAVFWLNWTSLVFVALGLALIAIFALLNMKGALR